MRFILFIILTSCSGNSSTNECASNSDCDSKEFCKASSCEALGECRMKPEICAEIWSPVCGCDNKTYSSACHANEAGVNILKQGECESSNSR